MINFLWRGKPITDVYAWAKRRGEKMVRYDVWEPWFDGKKVYSHTEECPESFWNNMRFSQDYRNVRRFDP